MFKLTEKISAYFYPKIFKSGIRIRYLPFLSLIPFSMLHAFLTIDPHVGRFGMDCLSEEQLMELLVQNIEESGHYCFHTGDSTSPCGWEGVECNESKNVTKISFESTLKGALSLEFLPPHLEHLYASFMTKPSPLYMKKLPDPLTFIAMNACALTGDVDIAALPRGMKTLLLNENSLTGSLDLTALPPSIVKFEMNMNKLSGSIALDRLPETLTVLKLSGNSLSGEINLEKLPSNLQRLLLSKNSFQGSISLCKLPKRLEDLFVNINGLSGEIRLENLPRHIERLQLGDNQFSGSLVVRDIPSTMKLLVVSNNRLTGTAVVQRSILQQLSYVGNEFRAAVDEYGDAYKCVMADTGFVKQIRRF